MDNNKNTSNIIRISSFYATKLQFATIILLYLEKILKKDVKVTTILENEITTTIRVYILGLKLKNEFLNDIEWKTSENLESIKEELDSNIAKEQIIIINGSFDFIRIAQEMVESYIEENKTRLQQSQIRIITLYEVGDYMDNILQILENTDKILNTTGEHEVDEYYKDRNIHNLNINNKNNISTSKNNDTSEEREISETSSKVWSYKTENMTTEIELEEIYEKMSRYKQLLKDEMITQQEYNQLCMQLRKNR